jgi:hypothetical protein
MHGHVQQPFLCSTTEVFDNLPITRGKRQTTTHGEDYAKMDRYFVNERGNRTIKRTLVKIRNKIGQVYNSTRKKKTSHNQNKNPSLSILLSFLL